MSRCNVNCVGNLDKIWITEFLLEIGGAWWVCLQATWCNPARLHAGLRRHLTNENRNIEQSSNPNNPRRRLGGKDSTNPNISHLAYKPVSCKYNVSFSFCCGLFVHFIACVEISSVLTGNPYPLVNVTDRIPYIHYMSRYHKQQWVSNSSCGHKQASDAPVFHNCVLKPPATTTKLAPLFLKTRVVRLTATHPACQYCHLLKHAPR